MRIAWWLGASSLLCCSCNLVLGLGDYADCGAESGAGAACQSAASGTESTGLTTGSSPTTSSSPSGSGGTCATVSITGDADREITVGVNAKVDAVVVGAADSLVWEQLAGPRVALPAAGATSFTHTAPYVHDSLHLRVTAKSAGCADSAAEVWLTPVSADSTRFYVSPSGDDTKSGSANDPLATPAMALARATPGTSTYLAAGNWEGDVETVIPDGVSLFGGYTPGAIWHRDHSGTPSTLRRTHDFTSAVALEPVFAFRCGAGDCTMGGFSLELAAVTNTGKTVACVVRAGTGKATLFENDIVRPALPETEAHITAGVCDTDDGETGGAGSLSFFDNRVHGGSGAPVLGILFLFPKANALDTWIIASNFFENTGSGDDSAALNLDDSATIVGNTFSIFDNDVAVSAVGPTMFANLLRGADGATPASGISCPGNPGGLFFNAVFGFTSPIAGSCSNVTDTLSLDPLMQADGHLLAGSPAIDYAPSTNASAGVLPMWDLDGDPRIQGANLDVGSDELQ